MFGTTIEFGYELNLKSNFSFDISYGYVVNSEIEGSCIKRNPYLTIDKRSGNFIKLGARYNWKNKSDNFGFFFGANIINATSIESGSLQRGYFEMFGYPVIYSEKIYITNYNLGLSGKIGITWTTITPFDFDLGVQVGRVLIENLSDCNSYMPGMGAGYLENRVQGIFRIKYKLNYRRFNS